jgi:hypothetical protein
VAISVFLPFFCRLAIRQLLTSSSGQNYLSACTLVEPVTHDDLLATARTAVLESSDRLTGDAVEKNRLECVPAEIMEGIRRPPGTPTLLAVLAFSRPYPS